MSLKDSVSLFFGESEKAVPFFNALYKHTNYSNPPNTESNPESIEGKEIYEMMLSKNYTVKEPDMKDNDIHNQFVDFIVKTALLHRHLDKPTTTHPTIQKMKNSFNESVTRILKQRLIDTDILSSPGNNISSKINDAKLQSATPNSIAGVANNEFGGIQRATTNALSLLNEPLGNSMNKSYFDYLTALCFLAISGLASDPYQQSEPISSVIGRLNNTFSQMAGNCGDRNQQNKPYRQWGDANSANREKDHSDFSHLCWNTYWDKGSNTSAVKNLIFLLQKSGGNTDGVYNDFLNKMHDNFILSMKGLVLEMCRVLRLENTHDVFSLWFGVPAIGGNLARPANPNDIVKKFHNQILLNQNNHQRLENTFNNDLRQLSFASFKSTVGSVGLNMYSDLTQDCYSKDFCQHILSNWRDLDMQARIFYREHLAVFKRCARNGWGTNNLLLDDRWMANFNQSGLKACDDNDLRLNLSKASQTSEMLMFAHTLPFLPVDKMGDLWYSDSNGNKKKINRGQFDASVLKKIYQTVYMGNNSVDLGKGTTIQLPTDLAQDDKKGWDHKLSGVVKNIIDFVNGGNNNRRRQRKSLEEMLDLENNTVWFSDGQNLFKRDQNGNMITYSEFVKNGWDCKNTLALNVGDDKSLSGQCENVATCLLQSPERLEYCLSQYNSDEMFNVAQSEIKNKMDPHVAKKLLRAFNIGVTTATIIDRNRNNMEIIQPISFNQWVDTVLNSNQDPPKGWSHKFRENLRKNQHLLNYIRGIIEFIRANPAILNVDKFVSREVEKDQQITILNNNPAYSIGDYTWPNDQFSDDNAALKYNVGLLANTSGSIFMPTPNTLGYGGIPAVVGTGIMSAVGLSTMNGGAITSEESANSKYNQDLGAYLKGLLENIKKSGLSFDMEDEMEIKQFCDQLVSTERRIREMVKVLETLQNLQNFVKCYDNGRHSGLTSGKILSLEEIVSNRDLLAWINHNIGDYQNCVYRGMEYINEGSNQVLKSYNDLIQSVSKNGDLKFKSL